MQPKVNTLLLLFVTVNLSFSCATTKFQLLVEKHIDNKNVSQETVAERSTFQVSELVKGGIRTPKHYENVTCSFELTEDSRSTIEHLLSNRTALITMNLTLPDELAVKDNVQPKVNLEPSIITWVNKKKGQPLMALDFRYAALSLGTLSLGTANTNVKIQGGCSRPVNFSAADRWHYLQTTLKDALKQVVTNKTQWSLCTTRVAQEKSRPCVQAVCCRGDTNFTECSHYAEAEYNNPWVTACSVIVFLFSPVLVLWCLWVGSHVYRVCHDGRVLRAVRGTSRAYANEPENQEDYEELCRVQIPSYAKPQRNEMVPSGETAAPSVNGDTMTLSDEEYSTQPSRTSAQNDRRRQNATDRAANNTEELLDIHDTDGDHFPVTYIPLYNYTPVRITKIFQYLFLLDSDNVWVNKAQALILCLVIYPLVLHINAIVIAVVPEYKRKYEALHHATYYRGHPNPVPESYFYVYNWIGLPFRENGYVLLVISIAMYIAMSLIVAIKFSLAMVDESANANIVYFGYLKLPKELQPQEKYYAGYGKMYHRMMHQLTLIVDPDFWMFWWKSVLGLFTCKQCKKCDWKCVGYRIVLFFLYFISLLTFLPMINIVPTGFLKYIDKMNTKDIRKVRLKTVLAGTTLFISTIITWWGQAFSLLVFMESSRLASMVIIYFVEGIVKNHEMILPYISIAVSGIVFLVRELLWIDRKYIKCTKCIFEQCLLEDEKLQNTNGEKQAKKYPLVVTRTDGIPLVPKELYDHIVNTDFPVRKEEFITICKLAITAFFLFLTGHAITLYRISTGSLGEALMTLLAAILPNILKSIGGDDEIKEETMKFNIRAKIKEYYCSTSTVQ